MPLSRLAAAAQAAGSNDARRHAPTRDIVPYAKEMNMNPSTLDWRAVVRRPPAIQSRALAAAVVRRLIGFAIAGSGAAALIAQLARHFG
ncbi:hypothetical protein WS67_10720 [Burkholderia singularis]|uniref:Uncharacterized protein n=2 Tax=Burkholderia singularis TaxID=1503053 RepID=A0A103E457_9BURK|nr:hypothetical protein WS67_10720 [Burkholderia singularis]